MKKGFRKIGVVLLTFAMALAMNSTVLAATTLDANGEQGAFTSPDTPESQNKTLVLEKEITAYNLEAKIQAPTISYTYTISPASVPEIGETGYPYTVTDATSKHNGTDVSVTVPVKKGVGTPTIANSGVVAWTATEEIDAGTNGVKNAKDISIDFSSVVFSGAGVYRYIISEELTGSATYAASGVTETLYNDGTNDVAASHTRYIDVYVRPADTYNDGSTPNEWDIYGYTCFYNNDDAITDSNKGTDAVKTTGFVAGTTDGSTAVKADSYYTYNLTISKTVEKDAYGAANANFPFTVLFTNGTVSAGTIVTNGATVPTGTDFTHNTSVDLTTGNLKGVATLKHGQQIKYVGIPNGTSVEVYETNTATGITYKVDTAVTTSTTTTTTDAAVIAGSAPISAVAQSNPKEAYQSTKATISTTADADDDNDYTVAITNTLLTISPTGFVVRFAPYALVLLGGILLIAIGLLVYNKTNKKETA